MLTLSASAFCSLFTTVYSVLETYYVTLLLASDSKSTAGWATQQRLQVLKLKADREALAQSVDALVAKFSPLRKLSRNMLWASVSLIMVAVALKCALTHGHAWHTWVAVGICVVSVVMVVLLVHAFRSSFYPIVSAYRLDVTRSGAVAAKKPARVRSAPDECRYALP